MLDTKVFDAVHQLMPKFNPALADGYAYSVIKSNEAYLDTVWHQIFRNLPANIKYLGYRRVTPAEEFRMVASFARHGKRTYDISKSSVYMVQYRFSLNGQEVPNVLYVYLPYLKPGSIMTIKNSDYVITPVIGDLSLSIGTNDAFIYMNRVKITFLKSFHPICVDGVRESIYITHSKIYNTDNKTNKNNLTTLPHYLFSKFGLTKAFKNIGVDIKVIRKSDWSAATYPKSDWVMCTTSEIRLPSRKTKMRVVTDLMLLIPREQYDRRVSSMVASFFYVADRYPERITYDDYDNPLIWRVILGTMILSGSESEGKLLTQMEAHITGVDGYLDLMVQEWLVSDGYTGISDAYQLFYFIIDKLPEMVARARENISSLYGKRLLVHRYLNEDLTQSISKIFFSINKELAAGREISPSDIQKIAKTLFPYTRILELNSGKAFVKSVSTASDCMVHKVTSIVTQQTECGSNRGKKKGPTFTEAKVADVSMAEIGGIVNLPDRDPTGRSSANMCAKTDEFGVFIKDPKFEETLNRVRDDIKRQ